MRTDEEPGEVESLIASEYVTLVGLLFECAARLEQRLDAEMQQSGNVAISTFEVLIRLLRTPSHQLRLTDLGRQLAITTGGVTRLIDRLETQHLVERVRISSDRRAVYARLTSEGREAAIRTLPGHIDDLRRTFAPLGSEQREHLEAALRVLRDSVSP